MLILIKENCVKNEASDGVKQVGSKKGLGGKWREPVGSATRPRRGTQWPWEAVGSGGKRRATVGSRGTAREVK